MQYCDHCDHPAMVLTEVEQDGDRFRVCDTCLAEGVGYDILIRTHYDAAADRPKPREFDWSE